jgi:CheY-like chemotaxis protein
MHANGKLPHILCINHSPDILNLMRDLLEEESFRVTTQSRLDKDLKAIAAMAPDVIIMDYLWAHSDDEWVLLTMLKMDPATRHIPLVLCTGAVREVGALQEHLATMNVTVVLKPFDIDHLIQVVNEVLGREPAGERPLTSTLE